MAFPAMLSSLNSGCGRLVGHQLLTHQNCLCVATIFPGRATRIGEVVFGLALEGTLRLGKDAVPSPEDFSIPPKAPSREMGCQTEGPSTKDGQCQTIHDLKQHSWKHELKSERVFYSFILLSF